MYPSALFILLILPFAHAANDLPLLGRDVSIADSGPRVGTPCSTKRTCDTRAELYCSPKAKSCQERFGPGEKCENDDSCYEGRCQGGVCGGLKAGAVCKKDVDCASGMLCIPLSKRDKSGFFLWNGQYEFVCSPPAKDKTAGALCRGNDCDWPYYCVLKRGHQKYCGLDPSCKIGSDDSCSSDRDCCRGRCYDKVDNGFNGGTEFTQGKECRYSGA